MSFIGEPVYEEKQLVVGDLITGPTWQHIWRIREITEGEVVLAYVGTASPRQRPDSLEQVVSIVGILPICAKSEVRTYIIWRSPRPRKKGE